MYRPYIYELKILSRYKSGFCMHRQRHTIPSWLRCVWKRLIFVGSQCGTCFMSRWPLDFSKIFAPLFTCSHFNSLFIVESVTSQVWLQWPQVSSFTYAPFKCIIYILGQLMIIIIRPFGAAVVPHPDTLPLLKTSFYPKLNARIIRKLTAFWLNLLPHSSRYRCW